MKKFNVQGLCVPEDDYMMDITGKIEKIKKYIDRGEYFSIEKPAKYGKSTILAALERRLRDEYIVIAINFAHIKPNYHNSTKDFCSAFITQAVDALGFSCDDREYTVKWRNYGVQDFNAFSNHITEMCRDRKVVLIIDNADKNGYNRIFLDFCFMLKRKREAGENGGDYTFYSVIFSVTGIYDKNHKRVPEIYSAPWDIASDFKITLSFGKKEIASMLKEYEANRNTGMNIIEITETIYDLTCGYPHWVSRICKYGDKNFNQKWNSYKLIEAAKTIIKR